MKRKFGLLLFSVALTGYASAAGLYYSGSEAQESVPLKWLVGANLIYDDNVAPGSSDDGEAGTNINPYVGLSFINTSPQTTWNVYTRLGLIYYFDQPNAQNVEDTYSQSRLGVDLTHRFNERLRFVSSNFVAYELEPDYSLGVSGSRQISEYLYWQTDNSVGYRWSERFATYTGFQLGGIDYQDIDNNDRFTWTGYNQFRYQVNPQAVITASYRYSETTANGVASDATDQFLLVGVEYRLSPTTIGILQAGAQFRDVDGGTSSTSPYIEAALNTQVNEQFSIRSFLRYGYENYDTVQFLPPNILAEFNEKTTLRIGVSGEYAISRQLSVFGGVDYIPSSYKGGQNTVNGASVDDQDETIYNVYTGLSIKFTDYLYGTLSYNYTDSSSDFDGREYDRNRVSVGIRAEF